MNRLYTYFYLILLLLFLNSLHSFGKSTRILLKAELSNFNKLTFHKDTLGSDELFKLARTEAFDKKNYSAAIELSKKAIEASPDYFEIHVFMGRIYNWTDKIDSARMRFNYVLSKKPDDADALSASYDLEYQHDNYSRSLEVAETALKYHPQSGDFIVKKAKSLNSLGRTADALTLTSSFLQKHPDNEPVKTFYQDMKSSNLYNSIGAGYNYVYFDKRFEDAWHLGYLSYGTKTKFGSANFILNYANRFRTNGYELELESYPRITDGLYAYLGGGAGVAGSGFSKYRIGFSLYKSLPFSLEAEGGLRYLQFDSSTTIFVVGLLKYIGNSYWGLRSYLTPSDNRISASINLTSRFFLSDDRNDYISGTVGSGLSPDDRAFRIFDNNLLRSVKAGIDYSRNLNKRTTLAAGLNWANEEYFTDTFGNQISISASFSRRF